MIKPSRKPYGYRDLLVYKKAEHLQLSCAKLTHQFPKTKTLIALADQMDRSARSTKQNIVEGWKRNSTKEYYDFLGFSIGANTELEEDCNDICKGMYPELMGVKGVMGERGVKGLQEMGGKGERGEMGKTWKIEDIETLKFYPMDLSLSPAVQLKLQCKELNFLFDRLQKSLLVKMESEQTLSVGDKFRLHEQQARKEQDAEEVILVQYGLKRLEDGRVVKNE